VDPGIAGAIGVYDTVGASDVIDLPTIGEGPSEMLDAKLILRQILVWCPDLIICERAQSMPDNGAASSFKFGKGYGQLLAAIQISGVPWTLVGPAVWKKFFRLSKDKELSRHLALQKFPLLHEKLKFKYTHQRAEALLIAMYGAVEEPVAKKKNRDKTSQIDLEEVISGG
jgi:crossover junction endodeoxyribonuclease RuvC